MLFNNKEVKILMVDFVGLEKTIEIYNTLDMNKIRGCLLLKTMI